MVWFLHQNNTQHGSHPFAHLWFTRFFYPTNKQHIVDRPERQSKLGEMPSEELKLCIIYIERGLFHDIFHEYWCNFQCICRTKRVGSSFRGLHISTKSFEVTPPPLLPAPPLVRRSGDSISDGLRVKQSVSNVFVSIKNTRLDPN